MQIALTHRESPSRTRPGERVRRVRSALPGRRMIALSALSVLLLSGCGGSQGTSNAGTAGDVSPARGSAQLNGAQGDKSVPGAQGDKSVPGAPADRANASSPDVAKPGAPVVGVAPKLTKSASLDLQVKDISAAAAQVRSIATGLQALVLTEQIGKGDPRDPQPVRGDHERFGALGTLTLSVPADKLDTALNQLAGIGGTVLRRTTSSQDVTSQYVDTESRLKTMRVSVARVRALMARATDIGQVVSLEGEVSRREADLESLGSQLEALKNSVERSTLTVSLSTPANETVKETVADNAFLAGMRSGWDAFSASAGGLFKGVGAVLPFAVFFALLGAPLWGWWRRRANRPLVMPAPPMPSA
jgi:hypothetical protein